MKKSITVLFYTLVGFAVGGLFVHYSEEANYHNHRIAPPVDGPYLFTVVKKDSVKIESDSFIVIIPVHPKKGDFVTTKTVKVYRQ